MGSGDDYVSAEDYGSDEIAIHAEVKDELLMQEYYSGVLDALVDRSDVAVEELENGTTRVVLNNGVEMEFEPETIESATEELSASQNIVNRGWFSKKWKKVRTFVKENTPKVVGALTFIAGSAIIAFPIFGPANVYIGSAMITSGIYMMSTNRYIIAYSAKCDDEECEPKQ